MEIVLALLGFGIAGYCFVKYFLVVNQKKEHQQQRLIALEEEKRKQEEARQREKEENEQLIQEMADNFVIAKWTEWDESIHHADGQLDRIRRAVESLEKKDISLLAYNPASGYARIRGTSGYYLVNSHQCSCPDFRERRLPCKHMYYLAFLLPDYESYLTSEERNLPTVCEDGKFWGFKFEIVGRGQERVKEYIVKHGGTFGTSSWKDITSLVLASDTTAEKVLEAKIRQVPVMSFEELQNILL